MDDGGDTPAITWALCPSLAHEESAEFFPVMAQLILIAAESDESLGVPSDLTDASQDIVARGLAREPKVAKTVAR